MPTGKQNLINKLKLKIMKVFKFYCGQIFYVFAAQTKELAISEFTEQTGDEFTICEEIPKSEWSKKTINTWEDDDFEKKSFKVSISDVLFGTRPQIICSNNYFNV